MDAISATASIFALIELTVKVVGYLKSAKHADADQKSLETELMATYRLLLRLADVDASSDELEGPISNIPIVDRTTFDDYKQFLQDIYIKIQGRASSVRGALAWPFKKEDIRDMLARIQRLQQVIHAGLGIHTFKVADMARLGTTRIYNRIQHDADQSRLNEALEWISTVNFAATMQRHIVWDHLPSEPTHWFIDTDVFKNWISGHDRRLFCPGIPGAGKSVLAARMSNHLLSVISADERKNLAYVFCDYKAASEFTASMILAVLLRQFVHNHRSLAEPLLALYEEHMENKTYPSTAELVRTILTLAKQHKDIFIIIDALDEVPIAGGQRQQLLDCMDRLHSESTSIRLLITSRMSPDIVNTFKNLPSFEISATSEDVEHYIDSRYHEFRAPLDDDLRKLVKNKIVDAANGMFLWVRFMVDRFATAHTKKQIKRLVETIAPKADPCKDATDIYRKLYTETMTRIDAQSQEDRELAKKTLVWITTATRHLTAAEIQCALSIHRDDSAFDDEDICSVELIITVCAGLVIVDPQTTIIRLVHYTTQEFFERIWRRQAGHNHRKLAETCLTYLCFDQSRASDQESEARSEWQVRIYKPFPFDPAAGWLLWDLDAHSNGGRGWESRVRREAPESYCSVEIITSPKDVGHVGPFTLMSYAANSWAEHASHCQDDISQLALQLLEDQQLSSRAFYEATTLHQSWEFLRMQNARQIQTTGLHLASAFGMLKLCRKLLVKEYPMLDPGIKDGAGRTPLMLAAHHGHCDVVNLLLKHRVESWTSRCQRGETVLNYAARQGHTSIVEMILKKYDRSAQPAKSKGDAIWALNFFQESALTQAALAGHTGVVGLLNAADAPERFRKSIHQELMFGLWPIHKAAQRRPVETFRLLVEVCKVSIDQQDPKGYSPFAVAVDWGNEPLVRYFITHQKTWLDNNRDQIILASHVAAANSRRLSVLELVVDYAHYVLNVPNVKMHSASLLNTAVDSGNIRAAIYIAGRLGEA